MNQFYKLLCQWFKLIRTATPIKTREMANVSRIAVVHLKVIHFISFISIVAYQNSAEVCIAAYSKKPPGANLERSLTMLDLPISKIFQKLEKSLWWSRFSLKLQVYSFTLVELHRRRFPWNLLKLSLLSYIQSPY